MRAKKKDLTKNDREAILQQLMAHLVDNKKLIRGALNKIALDFGVHRGTVQRVWKRANVDLDNKLRPCSDVSSRKKGHSGRNLKHENVANRLKAVPKASRTMFRSIAAALGMPRRTLHAYYRRGIFVKYNSSVRPSLTDANKVVRTSWAMDHIHALSPSVYLFDDMMQCVHVDEKWFYATRVKRSYYLAPGEEPPHRTCKSKRFITKDNARPHVPPCDTDIVAACQSGGWDMQLKFQPPNSPDLNVLDLGFFRAIQTLQEKNTSRCIDEIVAATEQAWSEVCMQTLNNNFLTLQACMRETICAQGNNNYKIPHCGKAKLLARGLLPQVLAVDNEVVECGFQQLDESDVNAKFDQLAVEVTEAMEMSEFSSQLEKLIVNDELKEDAGVELDELLDLCSLL
ncbi:hypothetical protein H257_00231 [Aphanomyces astaci]|uniref:DUF7769 domain-containing protein n=1 Tax=Aphanomyces astaci TaxID=112090 RepID=W4H9W6_APHAT|nr:hypothetical protein H257_00231 [Aphanomyces astaci]ETV88712.1 hypothetical protein H257_00231 [Aphanomyces astaci]|eukprot:XP_009821112.1 hypothetical protein H257_00231 [Aphanomyces astaci]